MPIGGIKLNIDIKKDDYILVVSPHADDESIGCGGLLSLYGKQCDLMLLTDGRKGHTTEVYKDEEELVLTRKREFFKAVKIAKANQIILLDIVDGNVAKNKTKVYQQDIKKYDYIFVPNRYESHVDHKVVLKLFRNMKKSQHAKAMIFEYEVWTPLRHPTWFLDISSVKDKKKRMIEQHKSQIADINYVDKGMALSCYRGMFNNVEYAEAFAYSEYSGIRRVVYLIMPKIIKTKIKKVFTKQML